MVTCICLVGNFEKLWKWIQDQTTYTKILRTFYRTKKVLNSNACFCIQTRFDTMTTRFKKDVPGKKTCANLAVSFKNISWTTIQSIEDRAAVTCWVFGSDWTISSPWQYKPLKDHGLLVPSRMEIGRGEGDEWTPHLKIRPDSLKQSS